MDQGRLLAHGALTQLLEQADSRALAISLDSEPTPAQRRALNAVPGLEIAARELRLASCTQDKLQHILSLLAAAGLAVNRVRYGCGDLEELFLQLTGRQLRD
ncbi:MAG: hypothetical protein ACRETQ_09790 [Gammaproteobacteria bacterium]